MSFEAVVDMPTLLGQSLHTFGIGARAVLAHRCGALRRRPYIEGSGAPKDGDIMAMPSSDLRGDFSTRGMVIYAWVQP